MRAGVIQSNYLPWRGYFDLIDDVDLFVFYDDVQYTKNDWRNRNRIKTATGAQWLTVPVRHGSLDQLICETVIDDSIDWRKKHLRSISQSYQRAPFFARYYPPLAEVLSSSYASLAKLNHALTLWLLKELSIQTPISHSQDYQLSGRRATRLLELLQKIGATHYLSGPSARSYIDGNEFSRHGITVEYKIYDYAPYPQQWGPFVGDVTVLDLLFNTGPAARKHLKSRAVSADPISPAINPART